MTRLIQSYELLWHTGGCRIQFVIAGDSMPTTLAVSPEDLVALAAIFARGTVYVEPDGTIHSGVIPLPAPPPTFHHP